MSLYFKQPQKYDLRTILKTLKQPKQQFISILNKFFISH
ncbi:MAG: hypothetical protein RLZZ540_36 [Bacteroidota bacterium]|jgi:hypothetical protein